MILVMIAVFGMIVKDQEKGGNETKMRVKKKICFDYQKGKCSRGDHCKYRHDRAQQVETDPELLCDVKLEDSSLSQKVHYPLAV